MSAQVTAGELAHLPIQIPADARALRAFRATGVDAMTWLRFELPAATKAAFVTGQLGAADEDSTSIRMVKNAPELPVWWRPDDIAAYESGERLIEGRPRYGVHWLIGGEHSGYVTAYLFFTTV